MNRRSLALFIAIVVLIATIPSVSYAGYLAITCDFAVRKKIAHDWGTVEKTVGMHVKPVVQALCDATEKEDACLYLQIQDNNSLENASIHMHTFPTCLSLAATWSVKKSLGANISHDASEFSLDFIDIMDKYQHKGIGSACIKFFDNKEIAQLLGYTTIVLASRESACAFYEKLGFKPLNLHGDLLLFPYKKEIKI